MENEERSDFITHLSCVKCGRKFYPSKDELLYVCPDCGLEGTLDVHYDLDSASAVLNKKILQERPGNSIWRYREILPISADSKLPTLSVGGTPIYKPELLQKQLKAPNLFIKDEGRNPTASLKDRASAVGLAKAFEIGAKVIATASTGNAASSMAGFAAADGVRSLIFVPERAPAAKIAQLLVFGSTVITVEGDYDQAWELCRQAVERWGWFNRSCAINPYLVEGKKTVIIEALEQLNWEVPETVWVAVGDGCTIGGVYKGLKDCLGLGLIDRMPRLVGVQAEGCSPFVQHQFIRSSDNSDKSPIKTNQGTIADSIAVATPRNFIKGKRAVTNSNGFFLSVTDDEIMNAVLLLGRTTGVFAEPAGAAALAGYMKALDNGIADPTDGALVLVTGNGLKDVDAALKFAGKPTLVKPDIEQLARLENLPVH